jgi:hypothetical protein
MSYVEESKDDAEWPNGQMHLIVIEINERYKDSGADILDAHARLEQKKLLRDLTMKRNEDPNIMFESLAAIKLLYFGTKIPLKDNEMKDTIFEKLPAVYANTLNTAEDVWTLKNPGKVFTLIKSYRNRFLNHIKFRIRMWILVHNQKKLSYLQEAEKDEEVVVVVDQEEEETAEEVGHHGMAEETYMEEEAEVMVL